ncbi:interferon-induced 35 kDa protein [Eublepharis macularius]|uniref:Interferon-induced 35 kDa protein n=1 Tax=Eublepharis macularius TaxID=481883 RepID=A0AA97LDR1_EUBMA|nr:interferon-induced 35 kDa protein [Eublepharis macularius]XP_054851282.1 interferon-induced 35 kDa protein [Eublepharis macularius]
MDLDEEPDASAGEPWVMMPEHILWEIEKYQENCNALEADGLSLEKGRQESEQEASRLRAEVELLHERLQQLKTEAQAVAFQEELQLAMEERSQLLQQKTALESELEQLQRLQVEQEEQCKVPPTPPERFLVFKGRTEKDVDESLLDTLSVKPWICYPLPGGTALVTFESAEVAQKIIAARNHRVQLDECSSMQVKAEPVELLMPSSLEVVLERSPRQVLLSGLRFPSLTEEQLLDKLALFFSKRQIQGGEVEDIQRLSGPGHVALTFLDDGVAERLIQKGQFQVSLGKETSKVKVSPYLDGKISDLQLCPSVCPRTVLLSGIPGVLDKELMSEVLEIHFQKPSKGGGEVEAIAYVPPGQCAIAVFEREENGVTGLSSTGPAGHSDTPEKDNLE